MPTVLDSFILEVNLDASKFTPEQRALMAKMRDLEEAAKKSGTAVESQSKKIFDLMSSFRREALGALALFFGGRDVDQFISYVTTLDASIGRLAKTTGMSSRETSAWQGAIREAGGTTEGASAALSGLSGEMNRFQLTGQSTILPVLSRLGVSLYDQNRNLKTSGQLWLELADAVSGMDPRQAVAFLQMIPGANQEMINFALLGRKAMEQNLQALRDVGVTTEADAKAAQEYQKQLVLLDTAATNLGRTLLRHVIPALTMMLNMLSRDLSKSWNLSGFRQLESTSGADWWATIKQGFGFGSGPTSGAPEMNKARSVLSAGLSSRAAGSPATSTNEMEAYIRAAAAARGMDPNVAVAVAKSEGLYNYTGDQGTSFGPYQLHYGGGLGDTFTKQTGKNASDPSTWKSQVDFSLDQAKSGGWGPWHGWKGAAFAGIPGGGAGGGGKSVTVNVGGVTVNTSSDNGAGIAKDVDASLRRSISAGAANYGPS